MVATAYGAQRNGYIIGRIMEMASVAIEEMLWDVSWRIEKEGEK